MILLYTKSLFGCILPNNRDSVNLLSVQKLNKPAVRIPSSPGFTIYTTQNEALHS